MKKVADGEKEEQLLQGLLNRRYKIEEALAKERLFWCLADTFRSARSLLD